MQLISEFIGTCDRLHGLCYHILQSRFAIDTLAVDGVIRYNAIVLIPFLQISFLPVHFVIGYIHIFLNLNQLALNGNKIL